MAAATMTQQPQRAWGRRTMRTDRWWAGPAVTFVVLLAFVVYSTFRVLENAHYGFGVYHSPYGSPDLRPLVPFLAALPFAVSPAAVLLPFPAGFRFTCYYYRKAYYRSFIGKPPACAVRGSTGSDYGGERGIVRFQNLHRYFLYAALVVLAFNLYDAIGAFGVWTGRLYVGLGSFLFLLNVGLLSSYTFGCHSFRHLVGGRLDCYSCDPAARARYKAWKRATWLNERHMLAAWSSLIVVMLTDLFVRGLSAGWWHDVRLV